ncbi:peptidase M20 [Bacterioplanes sanyensis]|uniref:N(2)-acetyl-L-2,4-diaminobutanoate deacetylase DoeB2 n=1 Tax=Bacterioplanes sanyensis TaxID=1249553 RepID=UPI001674CE6D|nr:N(2)-acetyl-L-2,4-diaminobutanoate deacetylase DoeB2 [Bacterioplanes sanyensis]GGY35152.1 peptidase M20 [Bacterioplanes sanyensis]
MTEQTTWAQILDQAIAFRHQLHQSPELTWQEERTTQRIRQQLDQLGIVWRECGKHGTVATLAADRSGRHVGLRGDIDALPIHEACDVPFKSQTEGTMHACGHDGHTAALWATAAWLKQHEDTLQGPVSFLFQPAEEGGHGAESMIQHGALNGIDVIFGWHNWPAMPFGQAVCPDGPVMSGNGTFTIEVIGKGGHASQPELCKDPVVAAAAITLNLQQIISRQLPPQAAAVVNVSSIEAPSASTVIPETAKLSGSIRLSDPSLRSRINDAIVQISQDTARAYGVEAQVQCEARYDATINHAEAAGEFRQALAAELGDDWRSTALAVPIMASEDFSYYLQQIPGAFALIGMHDDEKFHHPCHSPHYQFNDQLIEQVVRCFARLCQAPLPCKD